MTKECLGTPTCASCAKNCQLSCLMTYYQSISILSIHPCQCVSVAGTGGWLGPLSKLMCNEPESDTIIMSAHGDKWGTRHIHRAGAGHIL